MSQFSAKASLLGKVKALVGKTYDPKTWDKDIWMDVLEDVGSTTCTMGPSRLTKLAHPSLVRNGATVVPAGATEAPPHTQNVSPSSMLPPPPLQAARLVTRVKSQHNPAGDALGLIRKKLDDMPEE